eukprot:scaffold70923_cov18-Tisochrysis_lutea.AAC.1
MTTQLGMLSPFIGLLTIVERLGAGPAESCCLITLQGPGSAAWKTVMYKMVDRKLHTQLCGLEPTYGLLVQLNRQ